MESILNCEKVGYVTRKRKISKTILDELRPVFHQQQQKLPSQKPQNFPSENANVISSEKGGEEKNHESPLQLNEINSSIPKCKIIDNTLDAEKVILNVGGVKYEISLALLEKHPQTRLGQLKKAFLTMENNIANEIEDNKDDEKIKEKLKHVEFWFDYPTRSFESILSFYRKGKLHYDESQCPMDYAEDLSFWGFEESNISPCCLLKFQKRKMRAMKEVIRCEKFSVKLKEEETYSLDNGSIKSFLWNAFERPGYWQSQVTFLISSFFVLSSTILLIISTIPEWQNDPCRFLGTNETNTTICQKTLLLYQDLFLPSHYNLPILEEIFIAWFTLEYLVRLYVAKDKQKFFLSCLNTIDLLSIIPFYVTLLLKQFDINIPFLQVLLVFRVLRIFKLARYCAGLHSLGVTLRDSSNELGVLLLFMTTTSIVFSSLIYIAEKENPEDFHSIPESSWWAVITMTTVGYGDMVPKTKFGKCIGIMTAITGLIVISLPVATIVSNFSVYYEDKMQRESILKLKHEQMRNPKSSNISHIGI